MTDETQDKGTIESLGQEQSAYPGAEEADAAVWHEDLPPADSFQDENQSETSAAAEAEVDEAGEGEDDSANEVAEERAEAQRRGRKVLFGILAVGAMVVGGLAYNQFAKPQIPSDLALPVAGLLDSRKTSLKPQLSATDQSQTPKTASTAVTTAGLVDMVETPKSAESDLTAIYNAGAEKTVAPVEASVALPGVPAAALTAEKHIDNVQKTDVLASTPTAPRGTKVLIPTAVGAASQRAVLPAPALAPTSAPTAAMPVQAKGAAPVFDVSARLDDLATRVDALTKAVDQMTQQAQTLSETVEQQKNAAASLSALEEKVAHLEGRTGGKKEKPVKTQAVQGVALSSAAAETAEGLQGQEEVSSAKPAKSAAARKARKAARRAEARKQKAAGKKSTAWVLRAATPDSAWVAKSKDAAELQQVHVGETLPGIGRIRAINQRGSSWEVVGTRGTIH